MLNRSSTVWKWGWVVGGGDRVLLEAGRCLTVAPNHWTNCIFETLWPCLQLLFCISIALKHEVCQSQSKLNLLFRWQTHGSLSVTYLVKKKINGFWLFGFHFEDLKKTNTLCWNAAKAVDIPVSAGSVRLIAHRPLNIPPIDKPEQQHLCFFCDYCKGL